MGDVVILWNTDVPAAIERAYGLPDGSVLSRALKSQAGRLATLGRIDRPEWFRQVGRDLPKDAINEWLAYHGDLNVGLIEMLTTARRSGLRIYFLTNATNRLWDDLEHHGIRHFADYVFCSASVGLAKPDPKMYDHVISMTLLRPERILYIEDTPSWAEAGRRIGMVSHTYSGNPALKSELERLGVLS
ncbi:MAG: HAD-IA family hydrolase [Egibacteraceae bacterium]